MSIRSNVEYGDPSVAIPNEILRSVVGSGVHGIASQGSLTLPLPEHQRQQVLAVKRGEVRRDEVSKQISKLQFQIKQLLSLGRTPLPDVADLRTISAWAIDAQRRHWGWA